MKQGRVKSLVFGATLALLGCGASSDGQPDPGQVNGGGASGSEGGGASGASTSGGHGGQGGAIAAGGAIAQGGAEAVDSESFCERLMAVEGSFDARCASDPASLWSATYFSPTIQCPRLKDAVAAGRIAFDGAKGGACVDALEKALASADCTHASTDAAFDMTGSACVGVLAQKVPLGGACKSFYFLTLFPECSGHNYCDQGGPGQCVGSCVPFLVAGDACDALNSGVPRCGPGLSCANQQCAPLAGENQACGGPDGHGCDHGLYCDGATTPQAGVCKSLKASGPCASSNECRLDLHCDASGNCTPRKAPGEACTAGAHECGLLNYCKAGTCAMDAPGIGEPCGLIDGENASCGSGFCDTGPFASSGVCRPRKLSGQACTGTPTAGECAGDSARCDAATQTCVACDGP